MLSLDPEDELESKSGGRWSGPAYWALEGQVVGPLWAPSCETKEGERLPRSEAPCVTPERVPLYGWPSER